MPRQDGQFLVEDYFSLTGGLNTADSPFIVLPTQATDGYNYDHYPRGGVAKRLGHLQVLASADSANPRTLGFGLHDNFAVRTMCRAAGRVLKAFTSGSFGTSALVQGSSLTSDDASPVTNIWASSTTQPVVSSMFNTTGTSVLWFAGGAVTNLVGAYSSPGGSAPAAWTTNGALKPTCSAQSVSESGTAGGPPAGYYIYTLTYVKASTGAESNALAETTSFRGHCASGNKMSLSWTFSNVDTTKYTKVNIYRSSVGTAATDGNVQPGFTAGVLLAQQAVGTTTYTDDNTQLDSSANVPRAGSISLDNSQLGSGVYNVVTSWKGRLVTASNSTVSISDIEKPESWPLTNIFQVPSGGSVTGLATVSLTSGISGVGIDEALVIFKERECWAVVGSDYTSWDLVKISNDGCPAQNLAVNAGGVLAWVGYRGVFIWNGAGKPRCVSRDIEDKFLVNGDIDKSNLLNGFGVFFHQRQQAQWYLSSNTYGTQKYVVKLDLRLTQESADASPLAQILRGVFSPDTLSYPAYAGVTFTTAQGATSELLYLGDDAGQVYQGYSVTYDGTTANISFAYGSPQLNLSMPNSRKQLAKVVAWVQDTGAPKMFMDYWADYQNLDSQASTAEADITSTVSASSLFDVATFDHGVFAPGSFKVKGIAFYPNSQVNNNASGYAFRLRFRESSNQYTPVLYGYSVYFTQSGAGF